MEKIKSRSWTLAFISALAATGTHFYLSIQYYALRFGGIRGSSLCNVSELWNCDAVSASSYSQFLGVPMAVWGLVTNAILVFMLFLSRIGWLGDEERGRRYTLWLSAIVALASVVMGSISLLFLKNLCLFCVATYALSAFTLVGAYFWAGPFLKTGDISALFQQNHFALGSFVAIPILAFILNSAFTDRYVNPREVGKLDLFAQEKVLQWQQAPLKVFNPNVGLVLHKGQGEARMNIVEFADFRCPHCQSAAHSLDAFVSAHPDVRLVYKSYPLDGTCNPSPALKGQGDGISCEAAFLTQCSEKLFKKGWTVHRHLFEHQEKLRSLSKKEEVRDMVCKELDLDCAALAQCADGPEVRDEIKAMSAEGTAADIHGTPSIFVNGKSLSGAQLIPVLEKAYQSLKTQ